MTDNKLTDEQIIKALERCGNIVDSSCKGCAFHKTYNASCVVKLMKNTLDLINRLKVELDQLADEYSNLMIEKDELFAEAERYLHSNRLLEKDIERLTKENKVLKTNCNSMCMSMPNIAKAERAEARKELAERVKREINFPLAVWKVFDNILKEMDGEQNE